MDSTLTNEAVKLILDDYCACFLACSARVFILLFIYLPLIIINLIIIIITVIIIITTIIIIIILTDIIIISVIMQELIKLYNPNNPRFCWMIIKCCATSSL